MVNDVACIVSHSRESLGETLYFTRNTVCRIIVVVVVHKRKQRMAYGEWIRFIYVKMTLARWEWETIYLFIIFFGRMKTKKNTFFLFYANNKSRPFEKRKWKNTEILSSRRQSGTCDVRCACSRAHRAHRAICVLETVKSWKRNSLHWLLRSIHTLHNPFIFDIQRVVNLLLFQTQNSVRMCALCAVTMWLCVGAR